MYAHTMVEISVALEVVRAHVTSVKSAVGICRWKGFSF